MSFPESYEKQQKQEQYDQREADFLLKCLALAISIAGLIGYIAIKILSIILVIPNIHYMASFAFFYLIGVDLLYCGYVNSFNFSTCYDSYVFSATAIINILILITFIHTLFLFKNIRWKVISWHIIAIFFAVIIQTFIQYNSL